MKWKVKGSATYPKSKRKSMAQSGSYLFTAVPERTITFFPAVCTSCTTTEGYFVKVFNKEWRACLLIILILKKAVRFHNIYVPISALLSKKDVSIH